MSQQTLLQVSQKANLEDLRQVAESKADLSVVKTFLNQKLGLAEFDSLKAIVERMNQDISHKASLREVESINEFMKTQFDGLAKELLLRVQIKDLCTLLDQKANLIDIN